MALYNTNEELDTYFLTRLNTSAWDDASTSDKTAASTMATKRIDMLSFIGKKTVATQENEFPRDPNTTIPTEIKEAHAEIVLKLLEGYDPEETFDEAAVIQRKFAGVSTTYDTDANIRPWLVTGVLSKTAWDLMLPWLSDSKSLLIVNGIQGSIKHDELN